MQPSSIPTFQCCLLGPAFRTVALVIAVLAGERRDHQGPAEVPAATVPDFSPWSIVQTLAVGFFHGEKLLLPESSAALVQQWLWGAAGCCASPPAPRVPPPCPPEPGHLLCPGPAVTIGADGGERARRGSGMSPGA